MNSPIDYNQQFFETLQSLNPAQRLAVESIEGPVMVLAGPGTGKTHLLAARIGNILQKTDAMPNNILCLTYTEAGMKAMRDRLLKLIGPDAHKIHIFTFHAFCNLVIKENYEIFGNYDLELVSDLEKIELVEQIIDQLPLNHPLVKNINVPYIQVKKLLYLFADIKKECWDIEDLKNKIEIYKNQLPFLEQFIYKTSRKGAFQKGEPKTKDIEAEIQKMNTLKAAIDLYPIYLNAMKSKNRYDYDDMVLWVIKAFKDHNRILRNYQEKYQYILVDEFQDTNGSQNEILQLLTSYWDSPNIFIVGDDDQSIYEFQGARLKSMVDFYEKYKSTIQVIVLKENYRSTQNILDSSAALINYNKHRIVNEIENQVIDKQLVAKNEKYKYFENKVLINEYDNHYQEVVAVVDTIIELQNKGENLAEIAVLYAKNDQAIYLKKYLQFKNIPFTSSKKINILTEKLIQQWMLWLEYLTLEYEQPNSAQHLLFRILHFDCWNIQQKIIDEITAIHLREEKQYWIDILYKIEDLKISNFLNCRASLLKSIENESVGSFLEQTINQSGMLHFAITNGNILWQLTLLNTFMNYCKKEVQLHPNISPKELLQSIKNLEKNNLSIDKEQVVSNDNSVQLMTAHGSKGLEFKYVFLLDTMQNKWGKDKNNGSRKFSFPDTITYSTETDEEEAKRRLFFVAITRAKSNLQIGFSKCDSNGKEAQHLNFIDEIINLPYTSFQTVKIESEKLIDLQIGLLTTTQPIFDSYNKSFIHNQLENFILSIHALNSYLNCPISFYYDYILKLPTGIAPQTIFGNCLHKWLEWIFVEMKKSSEKKFESVEKSVDYFEKTIEKYRGKLSKSDFERYNQLGKATVEAYYLQNVDVWNKNVEIELRINHVLIDQIPVVGVIDKIEYSDNGIPKIVDYKSGALDTKKLREITANSIGGDYRRQLWMYKMMYENYRPHKPKIEKGEIAYLQKNQEGLFPIETVIFEKEEEIQFKDLIKDVYKKIMNLEFENGCNKEGCIWCNFAKSNHNTNSLTIEDDLDD